MKKFSSLLLILFVTLFIGCSSDKEVKSIEIYLGNEAIEETEVYIGETEKLTYEANDGIKTKVVWESSDESIASVDSKGNLNAKSSGTIVVSVYVKDSPFISDSIYVEVKSKPYQTGVGKGLTKSDPIFLGNEGKEEPIEVYFIEMQHIYADSIFIKKGNVEILIDSGYDYDGQFVNDVINEYCTDGRLDVLMVSHSDGDHINGLAKALSTVDNISLMVDYGGLGSGNVLNARNKYKQKGMIYHSAYDCVNQINGATDIYYLTDEFYFEVLNTGQYIKEDVKSAGNAHSLSVIFYYKDFSFFTAGDITTATESQLLKNEDLPEVTLYKASHHGSHGSNSQELLDTLNPKAVAISAARANQYHNIPGKPSKNNTYNLNGVTGHPAAAAIERIYKAPNISQNLNVYWNAVNGTMKFTSYGENDFTFTGSETMKGYYDLSLTKGTAVWNEEKQDFENKVVGEENFKLHETKVFLFRGYAQYLPEWARNEYFPN